MSNVIFIVFYFLSLSVVISVEMIMAFRCLKSNDKIKKWLGLCCIFASCVLIFYTVTVFLDTRTQYFLVSLFSSLYFISVDLTLMAFINFTFGFTNIKYKNYHYALYKAYTVFFIVDLISLMLNVFTSHVVTYEVRDTFIANYRYNMKPMYYYHLALTYSMVVIVMIEFVRKIFKTPTDYRKQYFYSVFGVMCIVLLNAVFLFFPILRSYNFLDYSIFGYGLGLCVVHWAAFVYPERGMLDKFRSHLLQNINQGVILFDYENNIIIWNNKAEEIFPSISFSKEMSVDDFIKEAYLKVDLTEGDFTLQSYIHGKDELKPIRLDYSILKNKKQESIGSIMVFSNYQLEIDMLTGFQSWEHFVSHPLENIRDYCVVVMDINGLTHINKTLGKNEGDQIILQLSKAMVDFFEEGTFFVRGPEAHLIAICPNPVEEDINDRIQKIQEEFTYSFQYGTSYIMNKNVDIKEAIDIATNSMREKKLLDESSKHSNLLSSLIKALEECDHDTEAHVKRTQKMGKQLGQRIGLSDAQQSDLSLLCLLHDIGKIGIPLDILNKPGKLSDSEWKVICSHVQKGYQIAMSSQELQGIADMILHHHERWDGKGYPDGLSRETIPLLSRVIAVVDAFDAMVNNRSYRHAMSKQDAMEELRRCAGSQFDPSIVSEFLLLLETIEVEENDSVVNENISLRLNSKAEQEDELVSLSVHSVDYSHYVLYLDNHFHSVDDHFTTLTGYSKEEAMHLLQTDLLPEEDREEYSLMVAQFLYTEPIAYFEHRLKRKDGTIINVFCSGRRYYDSSLRQEMADIVVFDSAKTYSFKQAKAMETTKRVNQLSHWENKYRRDSLTGLLNHESFKNDVEEILLKNQKSVMMLMIDVDHFKEFNDTHGHHAGDEFLIQLAQCIEQRLRKYDLACRMGGDEYACALIFPKKVSNERMIERAKEIFEEISDSLEQIYKGMTLSMGVCISSEEYNTFNKLYKKADQQLYISKKNGRARIS